MSSGDKNNTSIYCGSRFAPAVFIAFVNRFVSTNEGNTGIYLKIENIRIDGANLLRICGVLLHDFLKSLNYLVLSFPPKSKNLPGFALVDFIGLMPIIMVKNKSLSVAKSGVRENAPISYRNDMTYRPSY